MSRALITEAYLEDIASAIRAKLGVQDTYTPPQMAAAIESIPTGGITPTGTMNITQNGTHDVTQYASANVNVQPNLQSKTATENGTVTPDSGYDGLSSVVVNVSGGGGISGYILHNAYATDVGGGYVSNGNWVTSASTNSLSNIYKLEPTEKTTRYFLLYIGSPIGNRFRCMTTDIDPIIAQTGITGQKVLGRFSSTSDFSFITDMSDNTSYTGTIIKLTIQTTLYLILTKTNSGVRDINSVLIELP